MPTNQDIGEQFYKPLGRIVAKFALLDDSITMAIYTLTNAQPVSHPHPQVTSISGPMEQEVWRLVISGTETMQKIEMFARIAKHRFPTGAARINTLCKKLKSCVEKRNELMHHVWHNQGQIGFNPHGTPTVNERTVLELEEFGDHLAVLIHDVTNLHGLLMGLWPDA